VLIQKHVQTLMKTLRSEETPNLWRKIISRFRTTLI